MFLLCSPETAFSTARFVLFSNFRGLTASVIVFRLFSSRAVNQVLVSRLDQMAKDMFLLSQMITISDEATTVA